MLDNQLMERVRGGDTEAFTVMFDRYSARAYRVARSICRRDEHAEEAVQEAFISIWNARATYEPQLTSAAPWLLTIVRHRAIDIARREGRQAHVSIEGAVHDARPAADNVARQVATGLEASSLRSALAELPVAQREVIGLAVYGELTHSEIAAALSIPLGTVKGRMRLGLDKLRADPRFSRAPDGRVTDRASLKAEEFVGLSPRLAR